MKKYTPELDHRWDTLDPIPFMDENPNGEYVKVQDVIYWLESDEENFGTCFPRELIVSFQKKLENQEY